MTTYNYNYKAHALRRCCTYAMAYIARAGAEKYLCSSLHGTMDADVVRMAAVAERCEPVFRTCTVTTIYYFASS